MSESDSHVVELQLNQEEYTRAEFVANLGGAFGIFGDESTEEVIKRIFLSGLAQHDVHALDGEDHADGQQRPDDHAQEIRQGQVPDGGHPLPARVRRDRPPMPSGTKSITITKIRPWYRSQEVKAVGCSA
jgi:hypothetical protein